MSDKPPSDPVPPDGTLQKPDSVEVERRRTADPRALAEVLNALGSAMQRAAEPEAQASIRKAEIDADVQKKGMEHESEVLRRRDNHAQERFRWVVGGGYAFAAALFSLAVVLVATGHEKTGLLIITHAVTFGAGILGGRGIATKRDEKDDQG